MIDFLLNLKLWTLNTMQAYEVLSTLIKADPKASKQRSYGRSQQTMWLCVVPPTGEVPDTNGEAGVI